MQNFGIFTNLGPHGGKTITQDGLSISFPQNKWLKCFNENPGVVTHHHSVVSPKTTSFQKKQTKKNKKNVRYGAYRVAHQGVNLLDPTRLLRELGISDEAQVHLVQVRESRKTVGFVGVFVCR